tara:strand:+ start:85 stop:528 length:444 start_codon:yes stop_codon:yes gene_type:complete
MPDFSLGLGNLYGRFVKDDKQPVRRSTGGGQSGSAAFSQRDPSPKSIGGPLTGLGDAGITALSKLNPVNLYTGLGNIGGAVVSGIRTTSGDLQDISGKTQEAIGKAGAAITGAPGAVVGGVTAPVGQLSKDILPLAAIAAAVLLLRN